MAPPGLATRGSHVYVLKLRLGTLWGCAGDRFDKDRTDAYITMTLRKKIARLI
jgi:hypothetical protein